MDGHGGSAASKMVSENFPAFLTNEVVVNRRGLVDAVEDAWSIVCNSYQQQCSVEEDMCIADYDSREGKLAANTGSEDLVAGTTASALVLDEASGELVTLNCGDSRSVVISSEGGVLWASKDHTPETEEERLLLGIEQGLDYSPPRCRLSKWTIAAGGYEYSVGRSLEGPLVDSKGIVYLPDVDTLQVSPGSTLLSATDGLWEVMDSEEVSMDLKQMRAKGMSATDAARSICSMALQKGTTDNVSAVVVFL